VEKMEYQEVGYNKTIDLNSCDCEADSIISIKEINEYLGNDLTIDQAQRLRNDLVGIIDNIINSYLAEFK
jgi:hypothetical protein